MASGGESAGDGWGSSISPVSWDLSGQESQALWPSRAVDTRASTLAAEGWGLLSCPPGCPGSHGPAVGLGICVAFFCPHGYLAILPIQGLVVWAACPPPASQDGRVQREEVNMRHRLPQVPAFHFQLLLLGEEWARATPTCLLCLSPPPFHPWSLKGALAWVLRCADWPVCTAHSWLVWLSWQWVSGHWP